MKFPIFLCLPLTQWRIFTIDILLLFFFGDVLIDIILFEVMGPIAETDITSETLDGTVVLLVLVFFWFYGLYRICVEVFLKGFCLREHQYVCVFYKFRDEIFRVSKYNKQKEINYKTIL